eukprot:13264165-Ditylum_brightwellii.AAC.1
MHLVRLYSSCSAFLERKMILPIFACMHFAAAKHLLVHIEPSAKAGAMSDIVSAWRAINNGTTPATTKARGNYWHHWK